MVPRKNKEALDKLENLLKSSKKNSSSKNEDDDNIIKPNKSGIIRVCDLPQDEVKIGMVIRSSIHPDRRGVVSDIYYPEDKYIWIIWDGDDRAYSGYYCRFCKCEVISK